MAIEEKKPVVKESTAIQSAETLAHVVIGQAIKDYLQGIGMQDIRKYLNGIIQTHSGNMTADDKREFGRILREKFERMKQFSEASYTEVLAATGNFGY